MRSMGDDEDKSRFSSPRAVAAAFILVGVVLAALFIFVIVLFQRAC
jgi:hypothetical protein